MSTLIAYVSDNSVQVDAPEAEHKLKNECPKLLQPNEKVVLAFKGRGGKGRDDSFFTSLRIIVRNKTGLTGKKTKYLSIPYASIKAYGVETAGSYDSDSELKIMYSEGKFMSMDFVAKTTDICAVKRFLNEMILVDHTGATGADAVDFATPSVSGSDGGNIFDIFGDNATQIDAAKVEQELKHDPHVLLEDEKIELAFKCGRDSFLCTSKRLLKIDVKGITGKRIQYFSILWKCIRAFSVETAGSFMDRDSELVLYTSIIGIGRNNTGGQFPSLSRIDVDFKKGKSDIMAVQRFFADKLLGSDTVDASEHAIGVSSGSTDGNVANNIFSWLGDDNKMIDAAEMDQQYHSNPPILQNSERVEMAFKGRRDLVLFTSKRLLVVDIKGISGKKVEYMTLPWKNVEVFGVRSAGSFMDKDSEMLIWTDFNDIWWPPKQGEDDPSPPPIPRKTFVEIDFQKDKVDLMAVHRYLSERCLRLEESGGFLPSDVPVSPDVMAPSPPNAVSNFLSWLGDDAHAIDPNELDALLHDENSMLQSDEQVVLAYKSGRDTMAFTTKRILRIDVQGFSGKKVEWQSIPYSSIRAFSVESAGSWDMDAEVKIFCGSFWMNGPSSVIKQDLRKGKADIIAIQSLLAAQVIGGQDGSAPSKYKPPPTHGNVEGAMSSFTSWISGDGVEIDAAAVNKRLHEDPPILQSDESAEVCFKSGRDMIIFTTKRILFIDRQGFSGKKVEYMTYPLRYCDAFKVQSAGMIGFLSEAKASVYTEIPGASRITQDLKKKGSDIWSIQTLLANKILPDSS